MGIKLNVGRSPQNMWQTINDPFHNKKGDPSFSLTNNIGDVPQL